MHELARTALKAKARAAVAAITRGYDKSGLHWPMDSFTPFLDEALKARGKWLDHLDVFSLTSSTALDQLEKLGAIDKAGRLSEILTTEQIGSIADALVANVESIPRRYW